MSIVWTRNKALLAVLLIMLAVLGRNVASQAADLSNASLPNPDSYYKLVILKDYTPETGFQFIARDNAPYGSWIHWSLPHTWTVWQLHRGLMAFGVEKDMALLWAGGGLTILSMLLLALFVAIAVMNVGSPLAAVISSLVIASSPALFAYGQLVQITHHIFMLVPLAAAAACFLRCDFKVSVLLDLIGGAFLGLGLWISPETMPLVLAFAAMRAAIRLQKPMMGSVWPVAVGLILTLLTGWAIDPPPPTFSAWALDHISYAWLLFGALLVFLLLITDCCALQRMGLPLALTVLVMACVLAALLWLVVVPGAKGGPNGLIPIEIYGIWYAQIQELQPVTRPSQWLAYLIFPIFSGCLLSYIAWRTCSLWIFILAFSVLIYSVLGANHIRMTTATAFVSVLAFGIGVSKLKAFNNMTDHSLPMAEQIFVAMLVLTIPLQAIGGVDLVHIKNETISTRDKLSGEPCILNNVLPVLNELPAGIIVADSNFGAEILFKTKHNILSGNYHHNTDGLVDTFRVLRSIYPDIEARSLVSSRKISYIISCNSLLNISRRELLMNRMALEEFIGWLPWQIKSNDWVIYSSLEL